MALNTQSWTRADLERLPNDGNRYEVIRGELLVSPAPRPIHEALVYTLRRLLERFCDRQQLGIRLGENQAFVTGESEAVPDLVVRRLPVPPPQKWDDAPIPSLVVEVTSESTRRYDEVKKRAFYIEAGIPEYWIVDPKERTFRVITGSGDQIETSTVRWCPAGASEALVIDVEDFFRKAIGPAA